MALVENKPWERISWPEDRLNILYSDWGFYFHGQKQQLETAREYYDKSLEHKDDEWSAYYYRSHCQRGMANLNRALKDARTAAQLNPHKNSKVDLQICDCLFELNEFENAKINLHDKRTQYFGQKIMDYESRICVLDEVFSDTIGDTLGPFIMKNGKYFATVLENKRKQEEIDPRPLWKILRDDNKCDVLSILEKEVELLSPREISRRERAFKVFNEAYLGKTAKDVQFLKRLRNDRYLLLEQCKESTPYLRTLINKMYSRVNRFTKMLHARSPLYNLQARSFPNKKVYNDYLDDCLSRIQYQTRRDMFTQLRMAHLYRRQGKLKKLVDYVEVVMGEIVTQKTSRVMPWKFEFIQEMYNIVALAFADECKVPDEILDVPYNDRKPYLLKMPVENKDRPITFVFGNRSTHPDTALVDKSIVLYRKIQERLEKRMRFAKHDIEKCYLYHEMARNHLAHSRFDECVSAAKKARTVALRSQSLLWLFLSNLLIIKSHATLRRVERENEALRDTEIIVKRLKSPQLISFLEMLMFLNQQEVQHKRFQSMDSFKRSKYKDSEDKMSLLSEGTLNHSN